MIASDAEARAIVSALRTGAVPRSGLHHFATGMDALLRAVDVELSEVKAAAGRAKWIRGAYGSGKTFATRLLCAHARSRGFATAEVQISINDTPLHHLETVYRRLIERLTTAAAGEGALQSTIDAWLFEVGEEVTRLRGLSEDDPEFPDAVAARMEERLTGLSARTPAFAQVLRAYHGALEAGDFGLAQGLLAWLGGQPHVGRSVTSAAGLKGTVDSQAALAFLGGLLQILRESGHSGLVLVLDEVETIQLMPANTREKALDALRKLIDMLYNEELPGLYLVVTGTPDFFEGYKGLKSLQPLYQRVHTNFDADHRFDNLRAPQVRLAPFNAGRLVEVATRIRGLYPAEEPERVAARFDDGAMGALVDRFTQAFGDQISVAPRLFLRELVDILDRIDQHPDYVPTSGGELRVDKDDLTAEELDALAVTKGQQDRGPRRLDG